MHVMRVSGILLQACIIIRSAWDAWPWPQWHALRVCLAVDTLQAGLEHQKVGQLLHTRASLCMVRFASWTLHVCTTCSVLSTCSSVCICCEAFVSMAGHQSSGSSCGFSCSMALSA